MRRGGVLLEVLVSLALLLGAGSFAIGTMRQAADGLARAQREAMAADLARSILAEVEAGLRTIMDLRDLDQGIDDVGSRTITVEDGAGLAGVFWALDYETEPTEYPGLTRLSITVREDGPEVEPDRATAFTIVKLIRLDDEADEAYEDDPMLRGLPESGS